jgi:hypothetical protein
VSHLQLGNPKFGLPDGFFYRSYEPRFTVELRHIEPVIPCGKCADTMRVFVAVFRHDSPLADIFCLKCWPDATKDLPDTKDLRQFNEGAMQYGVRHAIEG